MYLGIGSRESRERAVGIEDQGLRIVPDSGRCKEIIPS